MLVDKSSRVLTKSKHATTACLWVETLITAGGCKMSGGMAEVHGVDILFLPNKPP